VSGFGRAISHPPPEESSARWRPFAASSRIRTNTRRHSSDPTNRIQPDAGVSVGIVGEDDLIGRQGHSLWQPVVKVHHRPEAARHPDPSRSCSRSSDGALRSLVKCGVQTADHDAAHARKSQLLQYRHGRGIGRIGARPNDRHIERIEAVRQHGLGNFCCISLSPERFRDPVQQFQVGGSRKGHTPQNRSGSAKPSATRPTTQRRALQRAVGWFRSRHVFARS
jgi:hypothetical protein